MRIFKPWVELVNTFTIKAEPFIYREMRMMNSSFSSDNSETEGRKELGSREVGVGGGLSENFVRSTLSLTA